VRDRHRLRVNRPRRRHPRSGSGLADRRAGEDRSGPAEAPRTHGDAWRRRRDATVVGYQEIKDAKHWLSSPKREELFGPLGVTNIRTFVDPQNPTRAAVVMDVPDLDKVAEAMRTQAAAEAMDCDGVLPETLVMLVEAGPGPE
jgi:hypothetical protein